MPVALKPSQYRRRILCLSVVVSIAVVSSVGFFIVDANWTAQLHFPPTNLDDDTLLELDDIRSRKFQPEVKDLVDEIIAGKVFDQSAEKVKGLLDAADRVTRRKSDKGVTWYEFIEQPPTSCAFVIRVDDKSGIVLGYFIGTLD